MSISGHHMSNAKSCIIWSGIAPIGSQPVVIIICTIYNSFFKLMFSYLYFLKKLFIFSINLANMFCLFWTTDISIFSSCFVLEVSFFLLKMFSRLYCSNFCFSLSSSFSLTSFICLFISTISSWFFWNNSLTTKSLSSLGSILFSFSSSNLSHNFLQEI